MAERSMQGVMPMLLASDDLETGKDRPLAVVLGVLVVALVILAGLYSIVFRPDGIQSTASGSSAALPAADSMGAVPATLVADEPAPEPRWHTPARTVFVLGETHPLISPGHVQQAVLGAGLRLVERAALEQVLAEHELVRNEQVSVASAVQLGRMLGGHIAVFQESEGALVYLRSVLIETGEIAAVRVVAEDADPSAELAALLNDTARLVPARGVLQRQPPADGAEPAYWIDLGSVAAVQEGDRFAVLHGDVGNPGAILTVAEVTAVERDRARVRLPEQVPDMPLPVRKLLLD